jgi:hypothetical protein
VRGVALQRGVQHADVEPAGHRIGIAHGQVLQRRRVLEAAPVQGHAQGVDAEGLGPAGVEDVDVGRKAQPARHLALGVVVAVEQIDRDAGLVQPAHLAHEEVAGVEVAPGAVVEVAGDDEEIDRQLDRLVHEVGEGVPRGVAQRLHRGVLVGGQPAQRTVEVDVGGVDESHGAEDFIARRSSSSESSSGPLSQAGEAYS